MIEVICILNMTVERSGVELGQYENAAQVGVETIRDRDIYQPVLTGNRYCGFASHLGERIEPAAGTAAQNQAHRSGIHTKPLIDQIMTELYASR
jgi:hypothetical protein